MNEGPRARRRALACVIAVLLGAGCAATAPETAAVTAPAAPSSPPRVAEPATVPAPIAAASEPEAPMAAPAPTASTTDTAETELETRYSFDVEVVSVPPAAIYLLARMEEPAPAACDAELLKHARRLGANRLYIDRSTKACRGAAYHVHPPQVAAAPPEAPENYGASLHTWLLARWKRPAGIPDAELKHLCVVTRAWTSSQLHIWKVLGQPVRSSGNPAFDESVRVALESAIDERVQLPEPKTIEMARTVRGAMISLSFTLGDPARCN